MGPGLSAGAVTRTEKRGVHVQGAPSHLGLRRQDSPPAPCGRRGSPGRALPAPPVCNRPERWGRGEAETSRPPQAGCRGTHAGLTPPGACRPGTPAVRCRVPAWSPDRCFGAGPTRRLPRAVRAPRDGLGLGARRGTRRSCSVCWGCRGLTCDAGHRTVPRPPAGCRGPGTDLPPLGCASSQTARGRPRARSRGSCPPAAARPRAGGGGRRGACGGVTLRPGLPQGDWPWRISRL